MIDKRNEKEKKRQEEEAKKAKRCGYYFTSKGKIQRKEILKSLKVNEDERLKKWQITN